MIYIQKVPPFNLLLPKSKCNFCNSILTLPTRSMAVSKQCIQIPRGSSMIYSWSVSTKLRIWHVKPLFFLAKNPGIEQLKSYCSWHLFLPFGTFTDATASHDKSYLTETSRSQSLDMSITMEPCFPLVYLFVFLAISVSPSLSIICIRDPGKRPATGKR